MNECVGTSYGRIQGAARKKVAIDIYAPFTRTNSNSCGSKAAADHATPEPGRSCKKGRQKNRRRCVSRIGIFR